MQAISSNSYLVKVTNHTDGRLWYQVHQTGQRSWDAMLFSTPINYKLCKDTTVTGNSTTILERLRYLSLTEGFEVIKIPLDNQREWRLKMFTILKTGEAL